MITVAFLIGLATIICIARCNKSVSLFFILLTAMLGGFAGGALVDHCVNGDTDDTNSTQVQPMLNSHQGIGLFTLVDVRDLPEPTGSAGKAETTVRDIESSIAPSTKIGLNVPVKPPIKVPIVDDS